MISPKGTKEDEGQANSHERQHAPRAMSTVTLHQCNGPKRGNGDCQRAMRFLFRREEMS
jgi:hypothetical protein